MNMTSFKKRFAKFSRRSTIDSGRAFPYYPFYADMPRAISGDSRRGVAGGKADHFFQYPVGAYPKEA